MLFNSIPFFIFFVFVFFLYWFAGKKSVTVQNGILLLANLFFYGYASLKMLPVIVLSTLVFYWLGLKIEHAYDNKDETQAEKTGGRWTTLGIVIGVGMLLYFKYFNFFIESFISLFSLFGLHSNWHTLHILMPLGISFFTFRLLAYVLDVNHGKVHAETDFVRFAVYVSFFPCILSGPIDRPQFIKQLGKQREFRFETAQDAVYQFLWGLFKKVVIADNCASYVDAAWGNIAGSSASTLCLAAFLYAFELYADFSGYSDMAIAVGKGLGLKITDNFRTPFFALNIADFWRRWHISLTQWMTDYVFMPLNLSFRKRGKAGIILAIIINFLIVGMWHGDNWIFAVYGLYHGLLFVPLILTGAFFKNDKIQTYQKVNLPLPKDFGRIVLTFLLVVLGFLIFRADSLTHFALYMQGMCDMSFFTMPLVRVALKRTLLFTLLMVAVEWLMRDKPHPFAVHDHPLMFRVMYIYLLVFCILEYAGDAQSFIYFQF